MRCFGCPPVSIVYAKNECNSASVFVVSVLVIPMLQNLPVSGKMVSKLAPDVERAPKFAFYCSQHLSNRQRIVFVDII